MRQINLAELGPEGFWDLEHNAEGAFRWTRQHFSLRAPEGGDARFATLEFACNVDGNVLRAGNGEAAHHPLILGWQQADVALGDTGVLDLEVALPFDPPGDSRSLGLMLRSVVFHSDEAQHDRIEASRLASSSEPARATDGFWDVERGPEGEYRWTRQRFSLPVPEGSDFRFATLDFASNVPGNALRVGPPDRAVEHPLAVGWQQADVLVEGERVLEFELDQAFEPAGDTRSLGIMLRSVRFHSDEREHRIIEGRRQNTLANEKEFVAGVEVLETVPPWLRVTLSKSCNIANREACVYCPWDFSKGLEKGSPDMTPEYFAKLGRYGEMATSIVDCSIGEPPMEAQFAEQVEAMTAGGRPFTFTSNGQTLGPKKRRAVLGKPIELYVSIDSATAEGYARYRDTRFNVIIENLRALVREKKAHNNLPHLVVSFLVMRSNRNEIADYLTLMEDVGVDEVKFRALFDDKDIIFQKSMVRGGQVFHYRNEWLDSEELEDAASEIDSLSHLFSGRLHVEWDAFPEDQMAAAENGAPICSEPWKTAYLLARGIMPCCYGYKPLATWDEIDPDDVEGSIKAAYNNEGFRELRRDLAGGKLSSYCMSCKSCPLTRAHDARLAAEAATDAPQARLGA